MPYIRREQRSAVDDILDNLVQEVLYKEPALKLRKGFLNYIVTRIVLKTMRPDMGWSYTSISDAISVLRDAATEMERRLMAKREDYAIKENGDMPEYIQ